MFAYLIGKVMSIDVTNKVLVILVQNIGYKIHISTPLMAKVDVSQPVELFIHTAVRENDISLYGFVQKDELIFFEQLISVSGIGPKTALEILGSPLEITQQAIMNEDVDTLTKIKGIGRKTAERTIVELKNKIIPREISMTFQTANSIDGEAILALQGLGYDRIEIIKSINKRPKEVTDTESVIKYFLKEQAK